MAHASVHEHEFVTLPTGFALPVQELDAVFRSPKLVPSKVSSAIGFLQSQLGAEWRKSVTDKT